MNIINVTVASKQDADNLVNYINTIRPQDSTCLKVLKAAEQKKNALKRSSLVTC